MSKATGQVPVNTATVRDFNANNDYFAANIKGNCLNSDQCPIQIKDGDLLLCHYIEKFDFFRDWQANRDRIVLVEPFVPNSLHINYSMVKQFVAIEFGHFFVMRMFNPPMNIEIGVDEISSIAIVDGVLDNDGNLLNNLGK